MKRAFSLVEIVAVIALLSLLMGLALWGVGGWRERELTEKIRLDLARIDSAKAAWRADQPQAELPEAELDRFNLLQPYLKVGLQEVTALVDWAPAGTVYQINAENTPASAQDGAKVFNRQTGTWE